MARITEYTVTRVLGNDSPSEEYRGGSQSEASFAFSEVVARATATPVDERVTVTLHGISSSPGSCRVESAVIAKLTLTSEFKAGRS